MTRLTDAELADVAARVADGRCALCGNGLDQSTCPMCEGTGAFALKTEAMQSVLEELRERRAADRELARLANVCRGFYHRNVEWPRDGVRNLLDEIDKLLEATER